MTKKRGPGRPRSKTPKLIRIEFRTTPKVLNRAKMLAAHYAGGNLSRWLEYAAIEAPRKMLVKR